MTDQIARDVLPSPDRPYEDELPLDANDPEATFRSPPPDLTTAAVRGGLRSAERSLEARRTAATLCKPSSGLEPETPSLPWRCSTN